LSIDTEFIKGQTTSLNNVFKALTVLKVAWQHTKLQLRNKNLALGVDCTCRLLQGVHNFLLALLNNRKIFLKNFSVIKSRQLLEDI